MHENNLLPAFHFNIHFKELPDDLGIDDRFMSISGLKAMVVLPDDDNNEAGKKIRTAFGPLVLKRAISVNRQSPLRKWVLDSLATSGSAILPEVLIEVLNEEHTPEMVFKVEQVSAIGWELGELHAGKSELLMESISLQYLSLVLV